MVEFLKIQFRLKRINEEYLDKLIVKGKIKEEDKIYIMDL